MRTLTQVCARLLLPPLLPLHPTVKVRGYVRVASTSTCRALLAVHDPSSSCMCLLCHAAHLYVDLGSAIVDSGAVALLVVCLQEPDVALKRACALALAEIANFAVDVCVCSSRMVALLVIFCPRCCRLVSFVVWHSVLFCSVCVIWHAMVWHGVLSCSVCVVWCAFLSCLCGMTCWHVLFAWHALLLCIVCRHYCQLAVVVSSSGAVPHLIAALKHADAKLKRQVCALFVGL